MQLEFHGAARTVTGSRHLLTINGKQILLDCGLYQGRRKEADKENRHLSFDPTQVDVAILSHAHIDHSGNIPNLVKNGFTGDIVCTHATRDLCSYMLADSGHIQERNVEYVNKRHLKRGEPLVEPIYTEEDAKRSLNHFVSIDYHYRYELFNGIHLTFLDAGHMLGSAIVVIDYREDGTGRERRVVFSGDIGRKGIPIIRDPETVDHADVLIMESTYGNRQHPTYPDLQNELKRIITETYQRGGKVIIPSFAVGRTQQIVYQLQKLREKDEIPSIPMYVDSPLAVNVTSVFRTHPECYDRDILNYMLDTSDRDPFGFSALRYIRSVDQSKQLNHSTESAVIISASGMAEFGRIVHHLKNNIENPNTTVVITSWQAPHTTGRRLVEKKEIIKLFGREYTNNAHIEVLNGFSGHADRDEMLEWVGQFDRKPERIFLVHGEEDSALAFKELLENEFDVRVNAPHKLQSFSA